MKPFMKTRIKERIDRISLSVQSRFRVGEMCLINVEGTEMSRIVDDAGVVSAGGELYAAAYKAVEHWTLFVFERRKSVL